MKWSSCRRPVAAQPGRWNESTAFRCLFCPAIVCDYCYSVEHTAKLHADRDLVVDDGSPVFREVARQPPVSR